MIGGGGHASVLTDILRQQGRDILAVVSPENVSQRPVFDGISHLKCDDDVLHFSPNQVRLVNGIGVMPKSKLKRKVNQHFLSLGYQFETVIATSASVSPFAKIGAGCQILHSAIIQAGAVLGKHSVINSTALIEHDVSIGEHCHIAPRATLCGQVNVGEFAYVGAGATVIQGITLAAGCIVGAGSVVLSDVQPNTITFSKLNQKTKLIKYDK
ncbi:acetyltransferase [Vibrio sp. 10N.247.311.12]|uniref:acetyltransferase n=1 Tax=Vibrio sp. 10N.247.311.12 TaxID=3229991 RepID=UPI00354DAB7A